jgi:hypothetical protein
VSLESAIYTRATSYAGLSSLISTRCYPDVAAQEATAPFLVYQIISAQRFPTFGARSYVVTVRLQIDCYATTHTGALALRTQVVQAFDRFSGTSDSIVIQDCLMEDERAFNEQLDTTGELYRQSLDFLMSYVNPEYA